MNLTHFFLQAIFLFPFLFFEVVNRQTNKILFFFD